MASQKSAWQAPELIGLTRDSTARTLDAIYGGQPGEEGVDRCRPKLDDCSES